jgi:hypothetical protein
MTAHVGAIDRAHSHRWCGDRAHRSSQPEKQQERREKRGSKTKKQEAAAEKPKSGDDHERREDSEDESRLKCASLLDDLFYDPRF